MPEPFCQTEPPTVEARAFVRAVKSGDADRVAELLEDAALRAAIDSPWFDFDAPAIVFASGVGNRTMLEVLLDGGASIDARSDWWAGGFGVLDNDHRDQAEWLVTRGATVDAHAAARHDWRDRLSAILSANPSMANATGGDGQRPLHVAASPAVVDALLSSGADLEARDVDHVATPVQYAVGARPDVCRHLLDRGAEPDIFLACALGDPALVNRVLASEPEALGSRVGHCKHTGQGDDDGGHIYRWNLRGITVPVLVARAFGHEALFRELLPRAPAADRLLAACWHGETEDAHAILAAHPGVMETIVNRERDWMVRAAWEGRLDAVRLSLDVGFDPHRQNGEGMTPLHAAAFHGFADIVRLLLDGDPSPPLEVQNIYGGTVVGTLRYGAVNGWRDDGDHGASIALLLEAGAALADDAPPTGHSGVDDAVAAHRLDAR